MRSSLVPLVFFKKKMRIMKRKIRKEFFRKFGTIMKRSIAEITEE